MLNLVIDDMAAHLGDFKPTHVTDCFTSSIDRVLHCVFDAVGRGTDQLDLFVDVIAHKQIKCFRLRSSEQIPESSLCGNCPERAALFVALLNERSKRGRLLEGTFRGKDATRREENRSVAGQSGPAKEPRSQGAKKPRSRGAKELGDKALLRWSCPTGCRLSPAFSTPGTSNQFSVVGSQLSAGNLRFANGTKIAAVWDGLCSAGSTGLSPALQRRDASPCGQYFRAKTTRRKGSRDWSHRLTLLRH